MKYKFFKNNHESDKLIIFFSGWALDDLVAQQIYTTDYNVICLFDYQDLQLEDKVFELIDNYSQKILTAWSMGVMVAPHFYKRLGHLQKKIAICGSPIAIDNKYGIPRKAYQLAIDNFSNKTFQKFLQRMNLPQEIIKKLLSKYNPQARLQELQFLKSFKPLTEIANYDLAIVANNDKIFPCKNLIRVWNSLQTKVKEFSCEHYPFELLNTWQKILEP